MHRNICGIPRNPEAKQIKYIQLKNGPDLVSKTNLEVVGTVEIASGILNEVFSSYGKLNCHRETCDVS